MLKYRLGFPLWGEAGTERLMRGFAQRMKSPVYYRNGDNTHHLKPRHSERSEESPQLIYNWQKFSAEMLRQSLSMTTFSTVYFRYNCTNRHSSAARGQTVLPGAPQQRYNLKRIRFYCNTSII